MAAPDTTTPSMAQRLLHRFWPSRAAQLEMDRARLAAAQQLHQLMDPSNSVHALAEDGPPSAGPRWAWSRPARDARSDTVPRLGTHRGNSRHLASTNPIAKGAIQTNKDRVVGTGLALSAQPHIGVLGWSVEQGRAWKAKAQAEFSLWADSNDCDWSGDQNFYDLQVMVLGNTLTSGDIFTLMPEVPPTSTQPHGLRLQLIEADRCGNPGGKMDTTAECAGIRFKDGRRTAAFIYDNHPGGLGANLTQGSWIEFVGPSGRRRLLHHLIKERPDQPRGVPYLTPVIDDIKRIGDYADAEIKAAVISAFFTVFIERPEGETNAVLAGSGVGSGDQTPQGNDIVAMAPGAVIDLNKGEKATIADPSRPNPNFEAFVNAVTGRIGMGLGIPRELLLKQFNASYSASKAALLDAWVYFRGVRTWLARSFCQPVYETWLANAVAAGRIQAPGFFSDPLLRWAYTRANWPGDSMGSINPKDEVAAYTAAIDARLVSRERAEWELFGTDWQDTFGTKAAEQSMLAAADLLPTPKAGAAATPAPAKSSPATEPAAP